MPMQAADDRVPTWVNPGQIAAIRNEAVAVRSRPDRRTKHIHACLGLALLEIGIVVQLRRVATTTRERRDACMHGRK